MLRKAACGFLFCAAILAASCSSVTGGVPSPSPVPPTTPAAAEMSPPTETVTTAPPAATPGTTAETIEEAPPAARTQEEAPAGAPPQGPSLGDTCIGADIGRRAVDPATGAAIMCDDYRWVVDAGQVPRHPWADSQREWADCTQTHTVEECRELLGD